LTLVFIMGPWWSPVVALIFGSLYVELAALATRPSHRLEQRSLSMVVEQTSANQASACPSEESSGRQGGFDEE
jgi:hypothetical protein